jgi:hypothetical protein
MNPTHFFIVMLALHLADAATTIKGLRGRRL